MTEVIEIGKRPNQGAPEFNESQPFGEFIITVLRYLPLVLSLAVLAGLAMFVLTTPETPEPTATTQVGLTRQVVWPFFDTARQRAVTVVEEPGFTEELAARTGQLSPAVEVTAPDNQAFVLIDVTSASPAEAAFAADTAAEILLEFDRDRLAQAAEAELTRSNRLLEASRGRVSELEARLAELVPIEAEARAAVGEDPLVASTRQDLINAELERTALTESRNEELRRQVALRIGSDEAQAEVASIVPELEILRRADAPDISAERSYVSVIAAAAAATIAGLALAIMWDRSRGPLASRWHAEQVAGVPVLADMGSRKMRERAAGLFLSGMLDGASAHGNIIALTGLKGTDTDRWLAMSMRYFQLAGMRVTAVTEARDHPINYGTGAVLTWAEVRAVAERGEPLSGVSTIELPSHLTLLDAALMRPTLHEVAQNCNLVLIAGGVIGQPESDQAIALADTTVLVARKNLNRVDQLRKAARLIGSRKTAFLGVVLGSTRLPNPEPVSDVNLAAADKSPDSVKRPALWT